MPPDDKLDPLRVLFQVRVIESFRGTQKVGDIVGVRTGFGGGDCGYPFKIGGKYLIDASKKGDMFFTGICSLTEPIDGSEVELRSLRRTADRERPPDLVGVLMRGTETDDGEALTPLSRVAVEARSIAAGRAEKTMTDGVGSFTFANLPEGTYDLILGLPNNLSAAYSDAGIVSEDQMPSISIKRRNDHSAECHIRIVVEPSGSIRGVVQSSRNVSIDGWVNADTVTTDDKPWNTVRTAVPAPDGKFSLVHLKPGRYIVQFTSRAGFVRGNRQMIELKDGERRKGVVLFTAELADSK